MFLNVAVVTIVAAIFSATAIASPAARSATVTPNFPVSEKTISLSDTTAHPGISKAAEKFSLEDRSRLEARQEFPADLLLCTTANCASCFEVDLSTFPFDVCETSSISFVSVAISQPSNAGLPFAVLVGPPGCASFAQIPAVNTCFNINQAFDTVALVD